MGQLGLHGLTGLVVGEYLTERVQTGLGRRSFMFGFVVGNLIPDLDYLAVVSLYPINPTLAIHLHRGFSHSLLAAIALGLGLSIAALLLGDRYLRYLAAGLSLGVAAHFVEDIFIWFSPVDVFWPASRFGVIPPVNIWSWYAPPSLVSRLLGAGELVAFALYYGHLIRLAAAHETNLDLLPMLRRIVTICWLVAALMAALAFDLPDALFQMALYLLLGLIFIPTCFYLTWRMQETIEAVGLYS